MDQSPEGDAPQTARRLPRLLVVMNDKVMKRFFLECIQPRGFKCLFAKDGVKALSVAYASRPDVILYEFNMTDRRGFEVLEVLRTNRRLSTSRVLLFADEVDAFYLEALTARRLGVYAIIRRPVRVDDFLEIAKSAAGSRQARADI